MMENGNGNEATNKDIVVVGNIHALSQTQMWVVYDTGATQQVIKANRADIGASGSQGIALPNGEGNELAFSFKACECPKCQGNNDNAQDGMNDEDLDAINARRVKVDDGDDKSHFFKCSMCNGKGSITQLPSGMNPLYPVEFDDIVQSLADGVVPEASQVMFPSMLSGGRANTVDNWNVPIKRVELSAPCPMTGEQIPVKPAIIQHFNELYADEDNVHGMQIGKTRTGVYRTVQHETVIMPWIEICERNGLPYSIYGANFGQDAIMQIKLVEGSDTTKADLINSLKAEGIYMSSVDEEGNRIPLSQDPRSVLSFGIQIKSTFDGAITFTGVCERLACTNGMITQEMMALAAINHKNGSIDKINFGAMAKIVLDAAMALWDEMFMVEQMNYIGLTDNDVERIALLLEAEKLLVMPKLGKQGQLTGGRVFRAMVEGWAHPEREFVSVGGDNPGEIKSLNHLYNVYTGIYTHQQGTNDKFGSVSGGKAIGLDATTKNLKKVHTVLRDVQQSAITAYNNRSQDEQSMTLKEYVAAFGIPMLEEMPQLDEGGWLPTIHYLDASGNAEKSHKLNMHYHAPLVA